MNILQAILGTLVLLTTGLAAYFVKDFIANKEPEISNKKCAMDCGVGFVTNFLDALGIGSYATSTAFFKLLGLCRDRMIPGTLAVSCSVPVAIEALIFMTVIEVDVMTLLLMLIAAIIGAFLGAGVVAKLPEKTIQTGMGIALLIAACFMLGGKFGWIPGGGEAIGLTGVKLVVAVGVNFILGALLTLGIGNYAPCMALVYALGMSPKVAFPIMMGSGVFAVAVASFRFIKEGAYERKTAMWYAIGALPGVLIAAYIVKSLPLDILMWLVICVVLYTAISMLRSAMKPVAPTEPAAEA